MSNLFKKQYLEFLRDQVSDEINYLIRHGHDNQRIYNPCPFCKPHENYYMCRRLQTLREFDAGIKHQLSGQQSEPTQPSSKRRQIGQIAEPEYESPARFQSLTGFKQLPLMYPKL